MIRSLRIEGLWAFKIPDAPITKELLKITRFTAAKPCDIIACVPSFTHGQFVAIECKQFKKWKAFSIRDLQDSQIEQMPKIIEADGKAFVFLNIRIKKPHDNRLIIFEFNDLLKRLKKGSIFAKDLKTMPYLKSERFEDKTVYDLSEWVMKL